ncbi:unnamed protein product [Amoebophrya sp. A25]|nr:unnamed protein product [Amoebophrya sp. A25]CAD7935717.1 unnamed protein product [Amoebophrya sp. A25]|eukprot:GSA25T00004670001.1
MFFGWEADERHPPKRRAGRKGAGKKKAPVTSSTGGKNVAVPFFSTPPPAAPAGVVITEERRLTAENEQHSADPNKPSNSFLSEGFLNGGAGLAWMQKQGTSDAQTVNIFGGAPKSTGELCAITPNKPLFTSTSPGDDDMNIFGHEKNIGRSFGGGIFTQPGAEDDKKPPPVVVKNIFGEVLGPRFSGHQGKSEGIKNEGKNDSSAGPGVASIGTTVAERRAAAAYPLAPIKFRVVARNAVSGEEFEIELEVDCRIRKSKMARLR